MRIFNIVPSEKIQRFIKEKVLGIKNYITRRKKYFAFGWRAILLFFIVLYFVNSLISFAATTVHDGTLADATEYETSRKVFRNPRGTNVYYSFYTADNFCAGNRDCAAYATSSDGTTWDNQIVAAANGAKSDFAIDIMEDAANSQTHIVLVYQKFNDKTEYRHGTIGDASNTIAWAIIDGNGGAQKSIAMNTVIDSGGRVWIAGATDLAGDSNKLYIDAESTANPSAPADAPSWNGSILVDDTDLNQKYVALINLGIDAIGVVWQDDALGTLAVKKATHDGVDTITLSAADSETGLSMTAGMFSVTSDDSTNAHILYKNGTSLIHQTIDFSGATPVFGAATTTVFSGTVDTLSLSQDKTSGNIAAFYVPNASNTDIYYKTSDATTISFGSENTINDGGTEVLDYLVASSKDWNNDSKIQMTYTTQATGYLVRFHEETVGVLVDPSVDSVSLNASSTIILSPNSTTSVSATTTVSDPQGCATISTTTAVIYREGVGSGCSANDNNCYIVGSCVQDACSGTNATYTCSVVMDFFADPTDEGSYAQSQGWNSEEWIALITVYDDQASATGSNETAEEVDVQTLLAFDVSTTTINYGQVNPNETSTEQTITVSTVGNVPLDVNASGTDMTWSGNNIGVSQQHWSTTTGFIWDDGTALGDTPTVIELESGKPTQSPSNATDDIYWKLKVPIDKKGGGPYEGTNIFIETQD